MGLGLLFASGGGVLWGLIVGLCPHDQMQTGFGAWTDGWPQGSLL